jgi:hypothetical protein
MAVDLALMLKPWRLFKINNATERVKQILQQFFAFELQGGLLRQPLPVSAFEDSYVFAYLMTVAMSVTDDVCKGLTVVDKARVARGAVIALSGLGVKRYADVSETFTQRKEEFMDGMHHAKRMVAVMHGELGAADDSEVAEAFKAANNLLKPNGVEDTAGVAAAILKDGHLGKRLKILREAAQRR